MWVWQKIFLAIAAGLFIGVALLAPHEAVWALLVLLTVPFLLVGALRMIAFMHLIVPDGRPAPEPWPAVLPADAEVPHYSVLVPLFREAGVVPDLVLALSSLDYPEERLDILLVVESVDSDTQVALAGVALPGHMRVLVVPDGQPRTKPRALNYALQFARGDFIVIYDAEDVPEPDQLHRALAVLKGGPKNLGCVQARLDIYNAGESWLSEQFAIEYMMLFGALLPALIRLGLPAPLSGTSNHFPRSVLDAAGGWDPFNVTEDADLGIRLARAGYSVSVLASTTWEEAPNTFKVWLGQRTRWLKGWMQTYLVHTRQPSLLLRQLGLVRCLGFHALVGGLILSALVHPWFYILVVLDALAGHSLELPQSPLGQAVWWVALFNLGAGYLATIAVAIAAVVMRRRARLVIQALMTPVYWLLVSLAAYRALGQLLVVPHFWEKTAHRPRSYRSGHFEI